MTACLRKTFFFFFRKLYVFHHNTKKYKNSLFNFPRLLSFPLEFRCFGLYSPLFKQHLAINTNTNLQIFVPSSLFFLLYQFALINDQLNAFFLAFAFIMSALILFVKSCIALIPCIKVSPLGV